jgi:hypothetical protein
VGYYLASLRDLADRQVRPTKSRRKFFAVRLVVAVPAGQGGGAGVGKKKWQRRRFDVAVAKDHVGFANKLATDGTRIEHRFLKNSGVNVNAR